MPSRYQEMLRKQRQNEETARAGLKWDTDEDSKLLSMLEDNVSFADIAKQLQRTEGSIRTRLILYAIQKMDKENFSLEQVAEMVHLTEQDITEYQEKKALRDSRRQNKPRLPKRPLNVTNNDIYDILLSMNRSLETLLSR
jgi:hypothetical protein